MNKNHRYAIKWVSCSPFFFSAYADRRLKPPALGVGMSPWKGSSVSLWNNYLDEAFPSRRDEASIC